MFDYSGKVVIVTGGAGGIGRALSLGFAKAGASVLAIDVDEAAGKELTNTDHAPGKIIFFPGDVSSAEVCRSAVETAVNEFGGLDVICNNAGIQPKSSYLPAHELPEEMWDRIIDVNLKAPFLLTGYAIPHLRARGGGVILNTASVQGLQSAHHVSAYAASKGGLLSLTRQLALDYAPDKIRVLAICPGTIDTNMPAISIEPGGPTLDEMRVEWGKTHPLGRIGAPEEIANVALFLASDYASFMTGEYVCVDGGMMAKGAWA